ncbi:histidine phosphatase family protein [Candidatus Pelagibacter sp.]|nr:histidine phosphatase family protein [Candidatus Pelagibacter sp.]
MKLINFLLVIFISLTSVIKADLNENLINELKEGGKLIFIRHALAPGSGDPENFDINECNTQRNLNNIGKNQAKEIGSYLLKKEILIDKVISSEWCRCKETALLAFKKFETKSFLNSFYSSQFLINKDQQIKDLKIYIKNWKSKKNLILVTHYVVISEILDYSSFSGEIVISDRNFKKLGSINIKY